MKESEGKRKEEGIVERFPPSLLMSQKRSIPIQCLSRVFIAKAPLQNTKKKTKTKAITRDKFGRNKKM